MPKDKVSPGFLGRKDVFWLCMIYVQWISVYVYYHFFPTTYAPGTEHHELLNVCIVASYHLLIFSIFAIFKGRAGHVSVFVMGVAAFLLYELSAFKYVVFAFELGANGTIDLDFAQLRFIDKQNILAGYMAMLAVVGTYICLRHKVGVARKIGTMASFAFLIVLSIYHITLYFHEFEPMAEVLEEIREEHLRPMVFSRNLQQDCALMPGLKCYRFMEGEPWPEDAVIEGERYLHFKKEDYKNGWTQLEDEIKFRTGKEYESTDDIIWTEAQRAANFDDTFVDQFDALILFSKYNREITVMIYPNIITRVLDVSERGAGAILTFCTFWLTMSLMVIWSHPNREPKKVNAFWPFVFWNVTGVIAFTYYFNLFFHAALVCIGVLMITYRHWKWLGFMVGSYVVFAAQVWLFLTLIKGALEDSALAVFAGVIGVTIGLVSIKLGAPVRSWIKKVLWVGLAVVAMELPLIFKDKVVDPFGWTPAIFFAMALACLVVTRKDPKRLFSGYYLVMAGIISSVMFLWLSTGLMQDSMTYGEGIGWTNPVNNVLANAYAVLFYFSFLVGGSVLYLSHKHQGFLEGLRKKLKKGKEKA